MNRRASLLLPGIAGLVLLAGLAAYVFGRQQPEAPAARPAPEPAVAKPAAEPQPAKAVAPSQPPAGQRPKPVDDNPHGGQIQMAPAEKPGTLTYPDGSQRPALNGVGSDVTILWDTSRPYSPIVGTFRDPGSGWDFYRHEDGSLTTVHVVEVNGVPQVCPYTVHPDAPVPLAPGAQQSGAPAPSTPAAPGQRRDG